MEGLFLATCEKCGCEYEGYYTHCPGCGSLIDADNDYSFQCGNCLRLVPDNAKRCPYCGIEFPQSGNTPKNRGSKTKSSIPTVYESESSSRIVYEGDIIKLAERATPELQYKLGNMYEECDSDYITAYKLFYMAAQKDYAPAMVQIGDCYNDWFDYEDNEEYKIDYEKAFQWYSKAATLGDAEGQYNLGKCYYDGTGVKEDKSKAIYWYRKSAYQKYRRACEVLGECYQYADGVDKDIEEAVRWYEIAAKKGSIKARMELGLLYYYGNGIERDYKKAFELLTKVERINTKRLINITNRWLTKSVLEALGDLYYFGHGSDKDYEAAIKFFESAAELDSNYALYSLGFCYEHGQGVEKNNESLKKAFEYYHEAAENGHAQSNYEIGRFYKEGIYVKEDRIKAIEYFLSAFKLGSKKAEEELKNI